MKQIEINKAFSLHLQGCKFVPLSESHLPFIMRWVNDPAITFYFARLQDEITPEEELNYIRKMMESKTDLVYSVFWDAKGDESVWQYIGQVSINNIDLIAGVGRVFMVVTKENQNRGWGGAILKAIQEIAFDWQGLQKLWLIVRKDNQKGRIMYRNAGFEVEGTLRNEYYVQDQYWDMIRMSLLKFDWVLLAPKY